jgi:DnaJ-class molecular chaperone
MLKVATDKNRRPEAIGLPQAFSNTSSVWWKKILKRALTDEDFITTPDSDPQIKLFEVFLFEELSPFINDEYKVIKEMVSLCNSEELSLQGILQEFRKEMEKRLKEPHSYESLKYLVEAKNRVVRDQVMTSIRETNGYFNLDELITFEDRCNACKGTGELYYFSRVGSKVPCKDCKDPTTGKSLGYKIAVCPTCDGNRIIPHDEEEIPCPRCYNDGKGASTGVIRVTCKSCQGSKTYSKWRLYDIVSTTRCHQCQGNGWKTPKKKAGQAVPFHPALSPEKAKEIQVSAPPKTLGDEIKSTTVIDE